MHSVVGPDGKLICRRATTPDARLIAAAPDLLEAARAVLSEIDPEVLGVPAICALSELAAAVRRAEGLPPFGQKGGANE